MSESKDTNGSFLQRWLQRKHTQQPRSETVNNQPPATEAAHAVSTFTEEAVSAGSSASTTPAQDLTDMDMPALDSLDEHSDYSGFLSPRVSEVLRRQALRKLFHLPAFNVTDGLNDYDEDYSQGNVLSRVVADKLAAGNAASRGSEAGQQSRAEEPEQAAVPAEAPELDAGEYPEDETGLET